MSKGNRTRMAWRGMMRRCHDSKTWNFHNYGGRGISVCERWHMFENFRADMKECPPDLCLDRIDNDGNYQPGNCRWTTRKEQQNNRRCNVRITFRGETLTAMQWSERIGIHPNTILGRLRDGLPTEQILSKEKRRDLSGLALGGLANGARQRAKTHCKWGHPFDELNTFIQMYKGRPTGRGCYTCHRERAAKKRAIK